MAKKKMTRADVEEEIRRVREHGFSRVPIPGGGAYPVEDDYPNLDGVDPAGVDMRGAILTGTKLPGAKPDRAVLTGTTRTDGAQKAEPQ